MCCSLCLDYPPGVPPTPHPLAYSFPFSLSGLYADVACVTFTDHLFGGHPKLSLTQHSRSPFQLFIFSIVIKILCLVLMQLISMKTGVFT